MRHYECQSRVQRRIHHMHTLMACRDSAMTAEVLRYEEEENILGADDSREHHRESLARSKNTKTAIKERLLTDAGCNFNFGTWVR